MFRKYFKRLSSQYYEKIRWDGYVYDFFVDYNILDATDITTINKCLMKKHDLK